MRHAILITVSFLVAFGIDQISKFWIVTGLDLQSRLAIDVLPPLINFRMGWNEGINFGLFSGAPEIMRWILIAIAIGISTWVVIWAWQRQHKLTSISAGLLAGGAIGNGLDRILFGAVRDFLNMSCCGINNPFVFNLADVAVFAGVFGLIYVLEIRKS
ncbi:MAG: signal peptidase II [Pseudomonadota bacterium]